MLLNKLLGSIALTTVTGCSGYLDSRCYEERYYCLSADSAEEYLQEVPDTRLLRIAHLEYQTSKPPAAFAIREMDRRGPNRARAMLYAYASRADSIDYLVSEMLRQFGPVHVCGEWLKASPPASRATIQAACRRYSQAA